jgi:hypothetical protein
MHPFTHFHIQRWRVRLSLLALCLIASVLLPAESFANSTGFDISYPQCGAQLPQGSFALLGVGGGRAFSTNSCFSKQYENASAAQLPGGINLYMNLNAAIGSTAGQGSTGPMGTCKGGDKTCQAYNYGSNAAAAAYSKASQSGPGKMWFLDIETANSWNAKASLNIATIQGAVDFLKCKDVPKDQCPPQPMPVGIYSTAGMWKSITGSWQNHLPVWLAGTAGTTCPSGAGFTGGPVVFVQNASGVSNGDQAC